MIVFNQRMNIYSFDKIEFAIDFISVQKIVIWIEHYSQQPVWQSENCK